MISMPRSALTLRASSSLPPPPAPPVFGPAPPTFDVVKNTGSNCAKSPSSCIRCMRTEPTIPRQPIKPTRFTSYLTCLRRRDHVRTAFSYSLNRNRNLKIGLWPPRQRSLPFASIYPFLPHQPPRRAEINRQRQHIGKN